MDTECKTCLWLFSFTEKQSAVWLALWWLGEFAVWKLTDGTVCAVCFAVIITEQLDTIACTKKEKNECTILLNLLEETHDEETIFFCNCIQTYYTVTNTV